jgi:hypothetical protein
MVPSPFWSLRPEFCYCQVTAVLPMWGAPSDDRKGFIFRSHNQQYMSIVITILLVSILQSFGKSGYL